MVVVNLLQRLAPFDPQEDIIMKRTLTPAIAIGAMLVTFVWSVAEGLPQLRATSPVQSTTQASSLQK